ncbi:MAG: hypothetical protein ACLRWA_06300 [Lachnospira sp.]
MIHSTDYLNTVDRDGLIIITNSHYSPIVELLDTMKNLDGVDAVIFPVLQTQQLKKQNLLSMYGVAKGLFKRTNSKGNSLLLVFG